MIRLFQFLVVCVAILPFHNTVAQTSIDIGPVEAAGNSVNLGNGRWVVTGSGKDIWSTTDSFHFLYFKKFDDLNITVFSESFQQNDSWAKAGLQIRDTLDKKSVHGSLFISGHQYLTMSWRKAYGDRSGYTAKFANTQNVWLRLAKKYDKIASYYKFVGDPDFTMLGEETFNFTGASFYAGIAVTSRINGELATFTGSHFDVRDNFDPLPRLDIGDTGRDTEVEKANGILTIKAAGHGIGGTSDNFGYVNRKFTGDISVTTHLHELQEDNIDSKGGLMIRASESSDSPHVSLLTNPRAGGFTMYYRENVGGETLNKTVGVWDSDMELKMTKTGSTVTCFYKDISFSDWFELGSATISTGSDFHVGVAVTSAYYGRHATLQTSELLVDGAVIDWSANS
ncbi:hypothetical protein ACHAXS_011376 [Conticribra weissflogii]